MSSVIKFSQLKIKKEKTIFDLGIPLYFSGFCLTDQFNFAEFYVNKIPKLDFIFGKLKFTEKDLIFHLDKEILDVKHNNKYIQIEKFYILNFYYLYFVYKYKNIKLYWLKDFLQQSAYRKIAVVDEITKKLVGILIAKTKKEIENEV